MLVPEQEGVVEGENGRGEGSNVLRGVMIEQL